MSKAYKRQRRLKSIGSMLYMILISLLMLPIALFFTKMWRKKDINTKNFFGMNVNFDKSHEETSKAIKDLNIQNIIVRFKMDDIKDIDAYLLWIQSFCDVTIKMNIIQNPNLNSQELHTTFNTIFSTFKPYVNEFQIGSTINRSKWGFYSVNEYLRFYKIAYKLRNKSYQDIKLMGPSVIDFEYHYTAQALFNFYLIKYDACTSLLYVDRTITPENKQLGFDLLGKIDFLYSLIRLSPQTSSRLLITEMNWPLKGSGDYSPTSELECVTEKEAANYLVRYYLLALATGKVEAVYWHQLIAVGFGLINPLESFHRRPSFYAFKTLLSQLQGAHSISFEEHGGYYSLNYINTQHKASILWTHTQEYIYNQASNFTYITQEGSKQTAKELILTASPIYLIKKEFS